MIDQCDEINFKLGYEYSLVLSFIIPIIRDIVSKRFSRHICSLFNSDQLFHYIRLIKLKLKKFYWIIKVLLN